MALLNVEKILAPISDSEPCGKSKEDGENIDLLNVFAQLQIAGETARKIEKARNEIELLDQESRSLVQREYTGSANDPQRDPQWREIAAMAIEILETQSKDSRVLCWLLESMLRSKGYRGFSEALDLIAKLVEAYGPTLFPVDATNPSYSLSFIYKLTKNEMFVDGISRVRVSPNSTICYASKMLASHLERASPDKRAGLQDAGLLALDQIEKGLAELDPAEIGEFMESLEIAIASAIRMDSLLQDKSGKAGFGFGQIRDELNSIRSWFKSVMPNRETESDDSTTQSSQFGSSNSTPATSATLGSIQTREEALSSLLRVASYFRKAEPHSPLSYALEQAVRWGKMPLPNLLEDLIADRTVLSEVYRRMGILEKSEE
ncbi:MAG: type VI secretion system protein TssA [Pirellula sp.]